MGDDNAAAAAEEVPVVPFSAWFQDVRNGAAHAEATTAIHDLTAAVREHGKDGELIIKVKVKPAGAGQVMVIDQVIVKAPEAARTPSLFFVDNGHNMLREDPDRPQLPLREVPPPTTIEPREVKLP